MKQFKLLTFVVILIFEACNLPNDPEPQEFGYLSMNVSVTITSQEAGSRATAVSTNDFRVTIYRASDDSEVMVFDPFSSAPPTVQLPTGEYYVIAHSNNLVDAAFDNPYYLGTSDDFTIDKEETETVDIIAELANTKVAILYSTDVVNTFDSYTGSVTVIGSGTSLAYGQGETREGYFVTEPLAIAVYLSYTKLDGSTIDRTFSTTIANPQPKTLYNINVDASLEDGAIVFNLTVDESVDTVDIDLGEVQLDPDCLFSGFLSERLTSGDTEGASWVRGVNGLINEVEYTEDDFVGLFDLTYDGNDRLISIVGEFTRVDLTYNGDGTLAQLVDSEYDFDLSQWVPEDTETFTYNVSGQLERIDFVGESYETFTYPNTSTNNPTQKHVRDLSDNVTRIVTYTYDDVENVYTGLGIAYQHLLDTRAVLFADNNTESILEENFDLGGNPTDSRTFNVQYQYDALDRPTQADFINVTQGTTTRYTYSYEDCP